MPTELAPDVRARVRSQEPVPRRPPAAPPPARRTRPIQRFGSTRVEAAHLWVIGTALLLVAVVLLLVIALG
jgi:hypothetical protein